MHEYEAAVIKALRSKKESSIEGLEKATGLGKDAILWAIENLSKSNLVQIVRHESEQFELTIEGMDYSQSLLPEQSLIEKIKKRELKINELDEREKSVGLQWAKKKGLIQIEGGKIKLTKSGTEQVGKKSADKVILETIAEKGTLDKSMIAKHKDEIDELARRKLITFKKSSAIESVKITSKGESEKSVEAVSGEIDSLTKRIIVNREWQGKRFKKYDVEIEVEPAISANTHPLRDTINEIKDAYAKMGFREISGPIVESSFWVQDSLMIPQDHPARDAQDTFYIENPESIDISDNMLLKRVAKEHEKAWQEEWSQEIAQKAMLRSHSTSVTSRFLYSLKGVESYELPIKIFSVGRVFRNENVDYRHLADFYQCDGMIIGERLTLANLFDTLTRFYALLGLKTRFVPTYFPFVEPGVEIQAFYKERDEWLEMGGAGMIRREIIRAAGKKFTVLAWGPGVERIVLMKNPRIKSVAELYNSGIGRIRKK